MKAIKPKKVTLYDGEANCVSEDYDDHGGGAFGIQIDGCFLYDSKNVKRLIKFLIKAEQWMKAKEESK